MSELNAARRNELPPGEFAFPEQRKLPLEDAHHVRNAIARFDQVEGVTDAQRDGVQVHEKSWRELGHQGGRP